MPHIIVVKKPGQPLEVQTHEELTLALMQEIVGGYLECIRNCPCHPISMWMRDDYCSLEPNVLVAIAGEVVSGTIFFTGEDVQDVIGLTGQDLLKLGQAVRTPSTGKIYTIIRP